MLETQRNAPPEMTTLAPKSTAPVAGMASKYRESRTDTPISGTEANGIKPGVNALYERGSDELTLVKTSGPGRIP
jgi:hypothetical protein